MAGAGHVPMTCLEAACRERRRRATRNHVRVQMRHPVTELLIVHLAPRVVTFDRSGSMKYLTPVPGRLVVTQLGRLRDVSAAPNDVGVPACRSASSEVRITPMAREEPDPVRL